MAHPAAGAGLGDQRVDRRQLDELERDAFWQAVEEAPVGDSAPTWH